MCIKKTNEFLASHIKLTKKTKHITSYFYFLAPCSLSKPTYKHMGKYHSQSICLYNSFYLCRTISSPPFYILWRPIDTSCWLKLIFFFNSICIWKYHGRVNVYFSEQFYSKISYLISQQSASKWVINEKECYII